MALIKCDNQGNAISREVPEGALALIHAGGNGSEQRYSYGDLFRMSGTVARALQRRGLRRDHGGISVLSLDIQKPGPHGFLRPMGSAISPSMPGCPEGLSDLKNNQQKSKAVPMATKRCAARETLARLLTQSY